MIRGKLTTKAMAGTVVGLVTLASSVLLAQQFKNTPEEQKNEDLVLNLYRDVLQYHHFDLASKYLLLRSNCVSSGYAALHTSASPATPGSAHDE